MIINTRTFNELSTTELYDILQLRSEVFVVEQNCVYQDLDYIDQKAIHIWTEDADGIAAYARIMDKGVVKSSAVIGRVITRKRGCGYGKIIMDSAVRLIKQRFGTDDITIEAQLYARGFYEKCGFIISSAPFIMDGIEHINMVYRKQG